MVLILLMSKREREERTVRNFMREKKIYCGEEYMEVDIFPYTDIQGEKRKGKRSKREQVSEPKQKSLNDKNARRYFTQLANTNFGKGDLHITATYKAKFLPETIEEAEKEVTNYFRRINYKRKKEGLPPVKYIIVTEYSTGKGKDEEKPIRIHHHILMNGGLDRDIVEELWCKRRKKGEKKGERIGFINADRLQPDENGVAALSAYLTKHANADRLQPDENGVAAVSTHLTKYPNRKKRWSSSQNLEKPYSRNNDVKYGKREIERIAKNPPDVSFWEKKYKGWTITDNDYGVKAEYNDFTGWSIYLKLRRRD